MLIPLVTLLPLVITAEGAAGLKGCLGCVWGRGYRAGIPTTVRAGILTTVSEAMKDLEPGGHQGEVSLPVVGADFGRRGGQVQSSVFGRTAAELCTRHSLGCRVRLSRDVSAAPGAVTNVVTKRIVVTRAVLEENDDAQAWTAAHEVGHLVEGRALGLRRYLPWRFFGWLGVGFVALWVPILFVANLPFVQQQPIAVRLGIGSAALLAGCGLLGLCVRLGLLRLGSHQRPREDEADAFAKSQGYPVTAAIADMLDRQERGRNGQPPSRRWYRYRCHRYPSDRINDETAARADEPS